MKLIARYWLLVIWCWTLIVGCGEKDKPTVQATKPAIVVDTTRVAQVANVVSTGYDTLLVSADYFRTNNRGRKLPTKTGRHFYEFSGTGQDTLFTAFSVTDTVAKIKQPTLFTFLNDYLILALPKGVKVHDFIIYSYRTEDVSNPIYDMALVDAGVLSETDAINQAYRNYVANPKRYEQMRAFSGAKPVNITELSKFNRQNQGDLILQNNFGLILTRPGTDSFSVKRAKSVILAVGFVFTKAS